MILYPAIDLKDGQCVRLVRGDMKQATVFSNEPAAQAQSFEQAGFRWLHLVDLNGAFEGKPVNAKSVRAILEQVTIPVQLGGGIRNLDTIEMWLEAGLSRVILGTSAVRNPSLVRDACRKFPNQIAVGIDARDGKVAVEGWAETSNITARDLALKFEDAGVAAIIYTDISRDGAMEGPNIAESVALAEVLSTPVILSGGISKLDDLKAIKAEEGCGIEGVIVGRALYDGTVKPAEALAVMEHFDA